MLTYADGVQEYSNGLQQGLAIAHKQLNNAIKQETETFGVAVGKVDMMMIEMAWLKKRVLELEERLPEGERSLGYYDLRKREDDRLNAMIAAL